MWADPRAIVDKGATVTALASALQLSPADMVSLRDRLDTDAEFVYVARTVEQSVADAVAALDLKGIYFVGEPKRFLPADNLAKGVIGTTDSFGAGSSGLEKQYDDVLTGTPGQLIREQDSRGRTIPQGQHEIVPAQPGEDLVLTLDRTLQYFTEQQLLQRVKDTRAKGGMVVVLDTKTGDVLAMASVKTDPTTGIPSIASYNAAVVDTYEPGSVAKIITASAALQEGTITADQTFTVPWFMKFGDDNISDAEPHPTWALNVKGVLVHSSNIGTSLITRTMTRQTQEKYMRAFGLGEPTGLDFPGESDGILAPASKWYGSQRRDRCLRPGRRGDGPAVGVGDEHHRQRRQLRGATARRCDHRPQRPGTRQRAGARARGVVVDGRRSDDRHPHRRGLRGQRWKGADPRLHRRRQDGNGLQSAVQRYVSRQRR